MAEAWAMEYFSNFSYNPESEVKAEKFQIH